MTGKQDSLEETNEMYTGQKKLLQELQVHFSLAILCVPGLGVPFLNY